MQKASTCRVLQHLSSSNPVPFSGCCIQSNPLVSALPVILSGHLSIKIGILVQLISHVICSHWISNVMEFIFPGLKNWNYIFDNCGTTQIWYTINKFFVLYVYLLLLAFQARKESYSICFIKDTGIKISDCMVVCIRKDHRQMARGRQNALLCNCNAICIH